MSRHPVVAYRVPDTSNERLSVTDFPSCVPAPGGGLRGPEVREIDNPYLGRFGLAPPRDLSQRVCPGSRLSTSAPAAPVMIGNTRRPKIHLHFRGSIVNRANLGLHHKSSASYRYTGRKILGHGHQIVAVRGPTTKQFVS